VKKSEETLEVMSLLVVIAGFMTHEFGTAIDDLERARGIVEKLSSKHPELKAEAAALEKRLGHLRDFVTYSQGYIRGASGRPDKSYPAKPRVLQVIRVFGQYATDRDIEVTVDIDSSLPAPNVPVSLYNGIALNLFTNALKAVTVKTGSGDRQISFRAWNEKGKHFLQVSDTGIGLPASLRSRVFDPLFTTTSSNRDPLGSGMGLGLTLVRRGVEACGGKVAAIEPPPGFSTCFNVELPLSGD
jgi:signal transduction histidine kinase